MIEQVHKTYICGICGAKYDSVEECECCEVAHADSLRTTGMYWDAGRKYPSYLEFVTPEGDTIIYSIDPATQTASKKIDCRMKDAREWSDLIVVDTQEFLDCEAKKEESLMDKLKNFFNI